MSALPSSKKVHSEKHKQILRQLLKEPANKTCVDCKTALHPRWASWNLGCFICIRCSGIHRSMGTHISRVKSVDLDVWTDEQVELMVKWGNAKCNEFWEAQLPQGYVPDNSKIENFIRTKYDLKKWAALLRVPDPMSLLGLAAPAAVSAAPAAAPLHTRTSHHKAPAPAAARAAQPALASLLDDDFGAFSLAPAPAGKPVPQAVSSPAQAVKTAPAPEAAPAAASTPKPDARLDLKKSILSLYSSPSSSTSSFHSAKAAPVPQTYNRVSPAHSASPATTGDLTSSLAGLNFGDAKLPALGAVPHVQSSVSIQLAPAMAQTNSTPHFASTAFTPSDSFSSVSGTQAKNTWANEWNDSSSSVNKWATPAYNGTDTASVSGLAGTFTSTKMDDDLFKNVWS